MGKLAFVFPGQGAQAVGMGKALAEQVDSAKRIFDLAGDEVKRIAFEGPAELLNLTIHTQPCLFAADLACAAALSSRGVHADGAAGFSLGEIAALAYSGLMDEAQAMDFVRFRAGAMHACAEENKGGMLAVLKLAATEVEEICAGLPMAYPVNYNCAGQTIVACHEQTMESLEKAVGERGGRAMKLAVSGAFHSPFMDKASLEIADYLDGITFGEARLPVYANLSAQVYTDPKDALARQVNHPVLWQKTIENMVADGFDTFIEAGPGKVLSGLIKKIHGEAHVFQVYDLQSLDSTVSEVAHAQG